MLAGLPRLLRGISLTDLRIQGAEVIDPARYEQSASKEIQDTGEPFSHVHPVDTQVACESLQDPGNRIVDRTCFVAQFRFSLHPRDQKQVDNPSNAKKAGGEKPDRSGNWLSEVKSV